MYCESFDVVRYDLLGLSFKGAYISLSGLVVYKAKPLLLIYL